MSVYLSLAKVDSAALAALRADPGLVERLFFADQHPELPGYAKEGDLVGIDDLEEIVDPGRLEDAEPWLARAVRGDGEIIEAPFYYWGAFVHGPEAVAEIAAQASSQGNDGEWYEQLEDLTWFYRAAAREGKAIIGGAG